MASSELTANGLSSAAKTRCGACPLSAARPPEGAMHFSITEYPKEALGQMNALRGSGKFCDVVVRTGEASFACHRVVLASCSPYFRAMFCGNLKEADMGEVVLHGVHADVMATLVDFAYTAELSVSEANVCRLLPTSCMFQITHAVDACCTFLEQQLDPSNAIGISDFAQQHGCSQLHRKAKEYIDLNFTEVAKQEEFMHLGPCELMALIKRDELNVKCESQVYTAVRTWVHFDEKVRLHRLEHLLCAVRCHFLTPKFIRDQIDYCRFLRINPQCKDYLCRILSDLEQHKPCPDQKRYPQGAMVIYTTGGYLRQSLSNMECYHPQFNQWFQLADLPLPRSGLGMAIAEGLIFAVGGRNNSPDGNTDSPRVDCFDWLNNVWRECPPMSVARNRVGVGVLDNLLYVVGGSHGSSHHSSVERYNPIEETWTMVAPMAIKRIGVGVTVVNRLLYAVGGYDGKDRLRSTECYNPDKDEWRFVAPMNTMRSGCGVVAMDDYIYAVGGYDGAQQLSSVECYDTLKDRWKLVAPMNCPRSALSVAVTDNKLYAMGGYDGQNFLSSIEVYNPELDTWKDVTNMSCGRSGHASAVYLGVIFRT
ncbi:PREDICTED: kelch-like ECH-associated protein 1 [Priapulus caudatus]|uniref:Kelch-like ECH-associated protein 1 n=1 Tax=Priapulus caudatus TaxID=37621 RepID=A0ABM1EDU9_PRICU|nr:PREDICTED: kelch-like ECH-associated protein 1 [Priapulus caudatus]